MMFALHRKHKPTLYVSGIALPFYMKMMFVPHRQHKPLLSATGISSFFIYVNDVGTSQETHLPASTSYYNDSFMTSIRGITFGLPSRRQRYERFFEQLRPYFSKEIGSFKVHWDQGNHNTISDVFLQGPD
jgi:hypothetical protein